MTPIEMMLDGVTWVQAGDKPDGPDNHDGVPYATHEGVLDIMGHKMRCYRLNTGITVFDADDLSAMFADLSDDAAHGEDHKEKP